MKNLKIAFAVVLAVCLMTAFAVPAMASGSGSDEYTYTVRIYAGAQGTIDGEPVAVYNVVSGSRINFDRDRVNVPEGSKYYVKGIRESGKDNSDTSLSLASIPVTGDIDYVVAYGILGNAVAYTVNYQDVNGNELLPSSTYYGNVGDKPVVAYKYIEGFQPQAYNLGKTLSENAAENVFTFVYTKIPTGGPQEGGQTPNPGPGGEDNPNPGPGGEDNPNPGPGGEDNPNPGPGGEDNPNPGPGGEDNPNPGPGGEDNPNPGPGGEVTPPDPGPGGNDNPDGPNTDNPRPPDEFEDLDDPDTPLAPGGTQNNSDDEKDPTPTILAVAGGTVGVGLLALLLLLLIRKRKRN